MNSIIWKGVPSTNIDGLLICELPPISKPPLRVKETTIDGRDGSIIEDLGYSSYDKSITIALRGNFIINNVIKYFTGEGDIIFSNEPDKVYTAKIVDQVDYNRLLRYRTAVVKFRVQPFKHKYLEAYKETQTATATGTSIVVNDSANAFLENINLVDETGTMETATVKTTGKNLLPYPYLGVSMTSLGVQFTVNDDGSIKLKGTATGHPHIILNNDFHFVEGVTYTISGGAKNISVYVCYDQEDGTRVYATSSFMWVKGNTFVQIYAQVNNGATIDETIYPMLEIGSAPSQYEPYKNSTAIYDYATNTLSNSLQTFEPTTIITNSGGASMTVEYFKHFEVFNEGLENGKPIMVLHGSGTVGISVNGIHIFDYTFPEGETEVVIDSEKQDAYLGEVLKNRNMNGEFPVLLAGTNRIEWYGYVESIEILPRSRWL